MDTKQLPTITEQTQEQDIPKAPLSVGLPFFIIVVCLIAYFVYLANQWLQDEQRLPVQQIVFSGELLVLDHEELTDLVLEKAQGSFFALDVNYVHKLMEEQPWVLSASIRKRWPSKLYIHIIEQKAVASWNDDFLINRYGDIFDGKTELTKDKVQVIAKIPQLFGPGGSEKTALTGYTNMQSLLNNSGQKIAQLVLSERFAWQVELESKIVLKLGRQNYINRLQRYIDLYPILMQQEKLVDYVDLRYDTGLAVGWQDSSQIPQTEQDNNNS
ncbi:cell division protein FtsQ/DivIB [Glaciecola petra]|uniref:Cell division protein FtsQ n=1 Tax=Glaciecola petra TaxID=3075602 RepID=A0ABU2ZLK2_9ALTE|nr:cell division protein FtsQ/DivIB [Aestuariibacter sp. P117]MDT0593502.1 cell division protein FtsQ/DivIB [Aestuariibacter sp. P117]